VYTNIAILPMDSRPCSSDFVFKIARVAGYELVRPPFAWYRDFMAETDTARMADWLLDAAERAEYLIVSVDMLLFGGLATSMRHLVDAGPALSRLAPLREIRRKHPNVKIFAAAALQGSSNSAYTPAEMIHRAHCLSYSQLSHKILLYDRPEDKAALDALMREIDRDALADYLKVRERCHQVCLALADMAAEGVVDFISYGVNDCSVYGLHRVREQALITGIFDRGIAHKAMVYTGTDEQCQVLLARAMLDHQKKSFRFFPRCSCCGGESYVPMFDDGPLGDNFRLQAYAAGCVVVDTPLEADAVFMINTPCQSSEDYRIPLQNARHYFLPEPRHNLWDFTAAIQYYLKTDRRVAVADVAFANGCDIGLMRFLKQTVPLTRLTCFSGWNTASNTIGTALSHTVARILYEQGETQTYESEIAHFEFLFERFADECFYQVVVRPETNAFVESRGGTVLNFGDLYPEVNALTEKRLSALAQTFFEGHFLGRGLTGRFAEQRIRSVKLTIRHPWTRTFEVWVDADFTTTAPARATVMEGGI
jgi:hypothetical protein